MLGLLPQQGEAHKTGEARRNGACLSSASRGCSLHPGSPRLHSCLQLGALCYGTAASPLLLLSCGSASMAPVAAQGTRQSPSQRRGAGNRGRESKITGLHSTILPAFAGVWEERLAWGKLQKFVMSPCEIYKTCIQHKELPSS